MCIIKLSTQRFGHITHEEYLTHPTPTIGSSSSNVLADLFLPTFSMMGVSNNEIIIGGNEELMPLQFTITV